MFESLQYAYVTGAMMFAPVWGLLYWYRKDTRKEMLYVSLATALFAVVFEPLFMRDYWTPEYFWFFGLEDFMYGFFAGGIVSVIYEEVYGKHFSKRPDKRHSWHVVALLSILASIAAFSVLYVFEMNTIYASFAAFVVISAAILWFRHDLLYDAILSGILFGLLTTAFSFVMWFLFPTLVHSWWHLENLSGVFVSHMPLEELVWAFAMGITGGPLYEFFVGLKFKK